MPIPDCRTDEDCPYTRACIKNYCLDPCFTKELEDKPKCDTCFVRNHLPVCAGKSKYFL